MKGDGLVCRDREKQGQDPGLVAMLRWAEIHMASNQGMQTSRILEQTKGVCLQEMSWLVKENDTHENYLFADLSPIFGLGPTKQISLTVWLQTFLSMFPPQRAQDPFLNPTWSAP